MLETVEKFLLKHSITNKNVIIAFSGGPDSVALSILLNSLKAKYNLNLILCYFNHGWRKEAKNEEIFTSDFAKKFNLEYEIGLAPENIKKNEETARQYRYNFLQKCADKFDSDIVMLAHNKNDNIETLLYRVIKGTSVKGLCSIPEKRDIFYRPLLTVDKKDILNFLNSKNQQYMVDSSNFDVKYNRNLIRNKILPLFSQINPNYLDSISNLIENSINTKKILDSVVDNYFDSISVNNHILRDKYLELPHEIRYEIINRLLYDELKNRDKKTIIKIDTFIQNNINSSVSINSKKNLFVKNNKIYLDNLKKYFSDSEILKIDKCGTYSFKNIVFEIEESICPDKFPKSYQNSCYLDITFPVYLRTRRRGDIFSPFGLNGRMKLKDYFINEKIPCNLRDDIILLANDNEICWVLGNKISENFKVSSKKCYNLKYRKINND